MKKTILTLILPCMLLTAKAQEYLCIGDYWYGNSYIPVEQIESITFGELKEALLPELMDMDENIKLFNEALKLTGMRDSLMGLYDNNYLFEDEQVTSIYDRDKAYALQKLRKGYTAFVETDKTYALYGIYTIEDLKAYAARVYDAVYPEDASVTDPTNRRNSLNRFVSYHLLDRSAAFNELTAAGISNQQAGNVKERYNRNLIDIADWYETMMPQSILKCSSPLMSGGEHVFINRRGLKDGADDRGVLVQGAQVIRDMPVINRTLNGWYHYISDIIAYDKQTQEVVLDEQILVNNSTISPEFMNNKMRVDNPFPKINSDNAVFLPKGSLKNVQVNNDETRMYYMFNSYWNDVQADEFMILGNFDITIKLPPVPAGTYELNLGFSASPARHVVACYLDEAFCDTIDLRMTGDRLGWQSDKQLGSPEAIAENDQHLFNQGYRKGLPYYYCGSRYDSSTPMRDNDYSLRRIITTFTTDGKSDHYLRIKSANIDDDGTAQFMMDFLELCPTHLLNEYEQ